MTKGENLGVHNEWRHSSTRANHSARALADAIAVMDMIVEASPGDDGPAGGSGRTAVPLFDLLEAFGVEARQGQHLEMPPSSRSASLIDGIAARRVRAC